MTLFHYRAVDRAGTLVTGEREADSEAAVLDWLKGRDLVPLRAAKAKSAAFFSLTIGRPLPPARRAVLTRELAVLLEAGLQLDQALSLLHRSASKPAEAALLAGILTKVQGGTAFSEALRAEGTIFPPDYVAMVKAGEASGTLAPVLERLADQLERAHKLRVQVQGQLIYPAVLTLAAIGSVVILMTVVVPAFAPLFAEAGRQLPPITRAMIAFADTARIGGPWLAALLLGSCLWISRLGRDHPVRRGLDRAVLAVPILGSLRTRLEAARFCRTLGTLLANGVALVQALTLSRAALGNGVLAEGIERVADGVRRGLPVNRCLRSETAWPPLMAELCQVGEETGRLAPMLLKLADMFDEEAGQRLERFVTLLTPMITLLLGMMVAGVLAGLLQTILSVNELAM
jgi:general secretion pathway protein F